RGLLPFSHEGSALRLSGSRFHRPDCAAPSPTSVADVAFETLPRQCGFAGASGCEIGMTGKLRAHMGTVRQTLDPKGASCKAGFGGTADLICLSKYYCS